MRRLCALWVCLGALAASAQARDTTRPCRSACERYVVEPRARASACTACLTNPHDRAAWMRRLPRPPEGALEDPAWEVRFGVLELEARDGPPSAERRLARWIAKARGPERQLACLTALHVAGARHSTLAEWLSARQTGEPSAAGDCAVLEPELRAELEPSLFSLDPSERQEALAHLSAALGRAPVRIVLDAMRSRPAELDEIVALDLAAQPSPVPVGRALLNTATSADTGEVNRLLAVYARVRDRERKGLQAPEVRDRISAVHALSALAPMSAAELASALEDDAFSVRMAAAQALARGEGRPLTEAAKARLERADSAPLPHQTAWVRLLADSGKPGCAEVLLAAWENPALAPTVRGEALRAAARCDWSLAHPAVASAAASPIDAERTAALWAAADGPTTPFTVELAVAGLNSEEPHAIAAGVAGAAHHHQRQLEGAVSRLVSHAHPTVRAAALRALATLAPGLGRLKALTALARDPDAEVRAAAAEALALVGGPQAHDVLSQAAKLDPDAHVKLVAGESLRRLGFGSPTP